MTPDIIAYNSLIAAALGAIPEQCYPPNTCQHVSGIYYTFPPSVIPRKCVYVPDDNLHFHSEWHWLEPAWDIYTSRLPANSYASFKKEYLEGKASKDIGRSWSALLQLINQVENEAK